MEFNKTDTLIKPTFNISSFGKDITIPLGVDTLSLETISWSGLNELLQVSTTGANVNIEKYPTLISDLDSIGILHEGDGIRYSRTFDYLADMSMWILKFNISVCVALAVTAWTSGDHSIDSVQYILTERNPDGSLFKKIDDRTINTGMTTIVSAVNAAVIQHYESNKPFKLQQGNILRLEIIFNSTDENIATSFEGIMPIYYFQEGATAKLLTESAMILHILPALDQAFAVLRDSDISNKLDFSGVEKDGQRRS